MPHVRDVPQENILDQQDKHHAQHAKMDIIVQDLKTELVVQRVLQEQEQERLHNQMDVVHV